MMVPPRWLSVPGVLLLVVTLLPALGFVSRQTSDQATLTILSHGVTVIDGWSGGAYVGTSGATLREGDRLITDVSGIALVTFFDGSELEVDVATGTRIDSLGQTAGGGILITIAQASGLTINRVVELGYGATYQLETPSTTALVRGTEFIGRVVRDPLTGQVIEEDIRVESGGPVDVQTALGTFVLLEGERLRYLGQTSAGTPAGITEPCDVQDSRESGKIGGSLGECGSSSSPGAPQPPDDEDEGDDEQDDDDGDDGDEDSSMFAWGSNDDGQLGIGTSSGLRDRPTPVGLSEVREVRGGGRHSLALLDDGTVWAWGANGEGQLGDGSTADRDEPVQVVDPSDPSGFLQEVTSIAAGGAHSLAITQDGSVYSWGSNSEGQLGRACEAESDNEPATVEVVAAKRVDAGEAFSILLTTQDDVRTWGSDDEGQLGDGGSNTDLCSPVSIGLGGIKAVAAGDAHALAVSVEGIVFAWGDNASGQLGDADAPNDKEVPVQVQGIGGATEVVAAGGRHSLVLLNGDMVKAWGENGDGQLGDGNAPTDSDVAVDVLVFIGGDVPLLDVEAGGEHSLALTAIGLVYTWGSNEFGQLGRDDVGDDDDTPELVEDLEDQGAIDGGADHSLSANAIFDP